MPSYNNLSSSEDEADTRNLISELERKRLKSTPANYQTEIKAKGITNAVYTFTRYAGGPGGDNQKIAPRPEMPAVQNSSFNRSPGCQWRITDFLSRVYHCRISKATVVLLLVITCLIVWRPSTLDSSTHPGREVTLSSITSLISSINASIHGLFAQKVQTNSAHRQLAENRERHPNYSQPLLPTLSLSVATNQSPLNRITCSERNYSNISPTTTPYSHFESLDERIPMLRKQYNTIRPRVSHRSRMQNSCINVEYNSNMNTSRCMDHDQQNKQKRFDGKCELDRVSATTRSASISSVKNSQGNSKICISKLQEKAEVLAESDEIRRRDAIKVAHGESNFSNASQTDGIYGTGGESADMNNVTSLMPVDTFDTEIGRSDSIEVADGVSNFSNAGQTDGIYGAGGESADKNNVTSFMPVDTFDTDTHELERPSNIVYEGNVDKEINILNIDAPESIGDTKAHQADDFIVSLTAQPLEIARFVPISDIPNLDKGRPDSQDIRESSSIKCITVEILEAAPNHFVSPTEEKTLAQMKDSFAAAITLKLQPLMNQMMNLMSSSLQMFKAATFSRNNVSAGMCSNEE